MSLRKHCRKRNPEEINNFTESWDFKVMMYGLKANIIKTFAFAD